jgi:predicted DNA-binding transcriptional regulator AlpA
MKEIKNVKRQLNKATKPRITKKELMQILEMPHATFYRRIKNNSFKPSELKILKKHHYIE